MFDLMTKEQSMDSLILNLVKFTRGSLPLKDAALYFLLPYWLLRILISNSSLVRGPGSLQILTEFVFFFLVTFWIGIGLWRCSKNVSHEWRIAKYAVRFIAAVWVIFALLPGIITILDTVFYWVS